MAKTGRKSLYRQLYCDALVRHMSKGFSFESFASSVGCHRDTLYSWGEQFPEFSDAKKRGHALSLLHWEKFGMDGMLGKVKGFNAAVWIFNMKNRFGWRDKANEVNVTVNEPSHLAKFSQDQLALAYQKLDEIVKAEEMKQLEMSQLTTPPKDPITN